MMLLLVHVHSCAKTRMYFQLFLPPPPPPPTLTHTHISSVCSYEDEVFSEWTQGVDDIAERNLDKPLLLRHPRNLFISVHSDPQVSHDSCTSYTVSRVWIVRI